MQTLRIGTRGSRLALAQAQSVANLILKSSFDELNIELVVIRTTGDNNASSRLETVTYSEIGVFVREIDQALLEGTVDIATHSMKDLPTERPSELILAAVPVRESPWDVLVSPFKKLADLPLGARIGTSSVRRKSELLRLRSDLEIIPIRGNIETRLRKIETIDGIITAKAALKRVQYSEIKEYFVNTLVKTEMIPSPGQGALGVIARSDDLEIQQILREIDHSETRQQIIAERTFLQELGGGCSVPIGAVATVLGEKITLHAAVNSPDGAKSIRMSMSDFLHNSKNMGKDLARVMKDRGAKELLQKI